MLHALYINKFHITLIVLLILSKAAHSAEPTPKEESTTTPPGQIHSQAVADAQRDAQLVVNKTIWQLTGCVGNIFGVGAALIYEPPLPANRLIGKSPEYVEYYTNEFRRETKGLQLYHASTGCISLSIGLFVWYIFG